MKIMERYVKILKMCLFWIYIWLFLVIPVSTSKANIEENQVLEILKIAIVNSYDIGHVCGTPQTQGIIDSLNKKLGNKYQFDFQVWYMKTDSVFDNQNKIDYIAKKVMSDIRNFGPDYIFVVDDAAFKSVGIPMSEDHDIFFTGLNKPLASYSEADQSKFYGVEEIIPLKRMFVMLDVIEYYPSKVWILSDTSTTSFYLTQGYKEEILKETSFKPEIHVLSRTSDLRKILSDLQKQKTGLIIHAYQNLVDDDYKYFIPKKYLVRDVLKYNKKHLDVFENCYYARNGVSMVVAPDFYKMGEQVAAIFEEYVGGSITYRVLTSKTIISINIQRLEELNMGWIYRKIIDKVDSSYVTY